MVGGIQLEGKDFYREVIRQKGLKNTEARIETLRLLNGAQSPMTVEEIFIRLKNVMPSVNISTVYRTVEALHKSELIIKTALLDDNKSRYEYKRKGHKHHLICTNCNLMVSLGQCPMDDDYTQSICKKEGFELTGHRLEIYGLCSDCKKLSRND